MVSILDKRIFHGLDVVRTLLAISVALGHFFYWNGVATYFPRSFFVAVDFFFVLSGFVITQSIIFTKNSSFDNFINIFAIKRIARLFPLYIFVFLITTVLLINDFGFNSDPFFYYFTSFFLLQSIGFDEGATHIFSDTSIGIAWSLSVEFWIGLLFFSVVYILRKKLTSLVMICLFSLILCIVVIFNLSHSVDVNFQKAFDLITFGSIRGVIGFSCGAISYIAYDKIFSKLTNRLLLTYLEVVIILIILITVYAPHSHKNEFIAPVLFAILLPILSNESGIFGNTLKSRRLSSLRYTSYSIYLIHPLFIFIWRKFNIPFSQEYSIIYMALVFIFSVITYRFIEKPGMRLKELLLKKR